MGLEAAWEDALRGRAGSLKVTVDTAVARSPKYPQARGHPASIWMLTCSAPCAAHCSSKLKLYRPQSRKAKNKKPAPGRQWWMCRPAAFWRQVSLPDYDLASWRRELCHWPTAREHRWSTRCFEQPVCAGVGVQTGLAACQLWRRGSSPTSFKLLRRTVHLLCGLPAALFCSWGTAEAVSMVTALRHSCNIYFL